MNTEQTAPEAFTHLDPHFAKNGKLIINMPEHKEGVGAGVDTDANNSIVYVANSAKKYVIGRILENGETDLTFAFEGQLKDQFAEGEASSATGVSVLPGSGRILLSGYYTGKQGLLPAFALLDSKGKYVREFGSEGKVIVPLPMESQTPWQIDEQADATSGTTSSPVITPDGKILFVQSGYVIRLNSDGSTDEHFNHGIGYIHVTHPEYRVITTCLLQTEPDLFLVGGICMINGKRFAMAARYHVTGELDTRYADNGFFLLTYLKDHNAIFKLVATPKQTVVGIGRSDSEAIKGLLFCLDENGKPEPSFNKGQPVLTPFDAVPHFSWSCGTVDDEGRVLTGSDSMTTFGDANDVAIGRFLHNGDPDTSFGPRTGWIRTQAAQAEAITVDKLGRIVIVATTSFVENLKRPVLLRFTD